MREEDLSNISGGETDCDLPPASETPRTDAAKAKFAKCMYTGACVCVDAEDMADLERELAALRAPLPELHVIFDGPPSHESGRFVEVESADGKSVRVGEWKQVGDYWHLILPGRVPQEPLPDVESQVFFADQAVNDTRECVPADLARAQGQRLAEAENECAVRNDEVTGLTGQLAEAETLIDTLRMQAAACMTATFQNTHASKKNRIDCCHPYWTQAYDDVCAAVDREITERERAETAERQLEEAQNTLSAALFQLEKAQASHTLILYNDDAAPAQERKWPEVMGPEPRGRPTPGACACPETEVEPSQPLPQSRTTT